MERPETKPQSFPTLCPEYWGSLCLVRHGNDNCRVISLYCVKKEWQWNPVTLRVEGVAGLDSSGEMAGHRLYHTPLTTLPLTAV